MKQWKIFYKKQLAKLKKKLRSDWLCFTNTGDCEQANISCKDCPFGVLNMTTKEVSCLTSSPHKRMEFLREEVKNERGYRVG